MGPIYQLSGEMLCHVFSYCTPFDNVRNTGVCRPWWNWASEIAKKQFIAMRQQEIEQRSENFLALVPEKLEFYCPFYKKKLDEIQSKVNSCTMREVFDFVQSELTERIRADYFKFFRVDSTDRNIPEDRRMQLADKAFVGFAYKEPAVKKTARGLSLFARMEPISCVINCFPIELFDLTLVAPAHGDFVEISGKKDPGTFCYVLHGRINEVTIGNDNNNLNVIPELFRFNTPTMQLTPQNQAIGFIWPNNIYVAELDAPEPKDLGFHFF